MSTPTKRLEYDSLKSVLQFVEPNLRIQLALRIPSIRNIEKLLPMKIKYLTTGEYKTKVNDTTYNVGIYRKYHNPTENPKCHQKDNESGGYNYDLDQYGFSKSFLESPLTEGDLDFRTGRDFIFDMTRNENVHEKVKVIFEEALRRKMGEIEEVVEARPQLREVPDTIGIILRNEGRVQKINITQTIEQIRSEIDYRRALLLPFHYQRNNIPAPFTPYIQLTIESPNGKIVERLECSKWLCEAMKYLNTVLFGKRRPPIRVSEWSLRQFSFFHCLPSDMKIVTKEIQSVVSDYEKLQNVLDKKSFPLNSLTIQCHSLDADTSLQREFVTNAKKLVIENMYNDHGQWIDILQNLKNPTMVLRRQNRRIVLVDYVNLIQNWLINLRPKGSKLIIGFNQLEHVTRILELAQAQFKTTFKSDRCFTIPINKELELEVSCIEFQEDVDSVQRAGFIPYMDRVRSNWALKLIVV